MFIKGAIQRELDEFYKALTQSDFSIRQVTKSAFTQARAKLNEWAFIRLNEVAVKSFYDNAAYDIWHGMRIVSVDGTRLLLPNSQNIKAEFGVYNVGRNADAPRSIALGSICYDMLNNIIIDAQLASYSECESNLLVKHLEKLDKDDLLLLDRGYPSYWLFFLLTAKKINFCVRMKDHWWKEVEAFQKSSDNERIVEFSLPKQYNKKLAEHPEIIGTKITCRLVKIMLDNGTIEVICTSLLDSEKFPIKVFGLLYDCRWDVEEVYKLLKSRIELEDFSGKTARAVKQDFHAKIFLMTLTAIYAYPVDERVAAEYKADNERKYEQQINKTQAIATTREILGLVFIRQLSSVALSAFDDIVYKTRELVRPGRKNPRNHKPKKPHYMAYKRL